MYNIYVEKSEEYLRIVEMNDSKNITRCYIDEMSNEPLVGSIYLGRVENETKLMGGVYINIGTEKSCYMPQNKCHKNLKPGEQVLVEILKEQTGNKGAVCTSKITLGGNLIVVGRGHGKKMFSKKIRSKVFRETYNDFPVDKSIDLVFRKNAEKSLKEEVILEYNSLSEDFLAILKKEQYGLNIGLVYEGKGILGEVLSELKHDHPYHITLNNKSVQEKIQTMVRSFPENIKKNISVELDESKGLFWKFDIENSIIDFRNPHISLPSGAEVVVDRKEALTVIDVNSRTQHEGSDFQSVNLQCAEVIPEIIISRNLSGIIVIDFINTENCKDKEQIIKIIKQGFFMDRNKVEIKDFDDLSLLHITRARRGKSIYEHLDYKVENKIFHVNVVKPQYMMFLVKSKLIQQNYEKNSAITVEMPEVYHCCFPSFNKEICEYMRMAGYKILVEYRNDIESFKIRKNIEGKI